MQRQQQPEQFISAAVQKGAPHRTRVAYVVMLPLFVCGCLCAGEGRDIELRHQRNPDVVFDYVRAVQGESTAVELLLSIGAMRMVTSSFVSVWQIWSGIGSSHSG